MVILEKLIYVAENKRWQENYKPKHSIDAKGGWYRYTTRFAFPIKDSIGKVDRYNLYRIEILVRCTSDGELYLYDLVNVKKEGESQKIRKLIPRLSKMLYGNKPTSLISNIIHVISGCQYNISLLTE